MKADIIYIRPPTQTNPNMLQICSGPCHSGAQLSTSPQSVATAASILNLDKDGAAAFTKVPYSICVCLISTHQKPKESTYLERFVDGQLQVIMKIFIRILRVADHFVYDHRKRKMTYV